MIRVNEQLYKRHIKSNKSTYQKLLSYKSFWFNRYLTTLSNEERTEISKELSQHSEHKKLKDKIEEYCRKLEIKWNDISSCRIWNNKYIYGSFHQKEYQEKYNLG